MVRIAAAPTHLGTKATGCHISTINGNAFIIQVRQTWPRLGTRLEKMRRLSKECQFILRSVQSLKRTRLQSLGMIKFLVTLVADSSHRDVPTYMARGKSSCMHHKHWCWSNYGGHGLAQCKWPLCHEQDRNRLPGDCR